MNRNDEFTEMMKELDEQIPEVSESIKRGSRRKARKRFLYQPLMGLAAMFMLFVLSVNLCAPVAKACSNIPFLKDLTKAVTFSKSLRAALENDYAQGVNLTQTKDGVTIEVTMMVVDQKRLTVFYRLTTEQDGVAVNCTVSKDAEGTLYSHTYLNNMFPLTGTIQCEEMQYISIDFWEEMPEVMPLCMTVWDTKAYREDVRAGLTDESNDLIGWEAQAEQYEITSFLFELDMDLAQIPATRTYDVNQKVELDGQTYTITNIIVHPTYMDINMVPDAGNTATLIYLFFRVENENGEIFYDNRSGWGESAGFDKGIMVGAESPYFYDGALTKIVVTGAIWQEDGKERTYVNLATGEVENLPENITFKEIRATEGTYDLIFDMKYMRRVDEETGDPYGRKFWMVPFELCYDESGKQYCGEARYDEEINEEYRLVGDSMGYALRLEDYPYDEVWLENSYSGIWYAEREVTVNLK